MPAIKDGKFGYLKQNGEVACEFKYAADAVINCGWVPMTWLYNEDGSITVLSAAAGELPQRFENIELEHSDEGCSPLFIAQVSKGKVGVFDMYGEEIIPADGQYDNKYDFQISQDAAVIVAATGYGEATIYQLSNDYNWRGESEQ